MCVCICFGSDQHEQQQQQTKQKLIGSTSTQKHWRLIKTK